ncbi:hypothetical protein [Rhodococcus sp. 66b]|uniref:hypothetical protein n=1 Tax=Rhodococcus sp. 66b TaxID=1945511 RepID=UPI0009BAC5AD|nr:hypothetical protein [Rhodococcus sp. 66b]OQM78053.1 hypothetical protein B0E55_06098 [Rhodococcus sp. 66b]
MAKFRAGNIGLIPYTKLYFLITDGTHDDPIITEIVVGPGGDRPLRANALNRRLRKIGSRHGGIGVVLSAVGALAVLSADTGSDSQATIDFENDTTDIACARRSSETLQLRQVLPTLAWVSVETMDVTRTAASRRNLS